MIVSDVRALMNCNFRKGIEDTRDSEGNAASWWIQNWLNCVGYFRTIYIRKFNLKLYLPKLENKVFIWNYFFYIKEQDLYSCEWLIRSM
jgi:hypothetical protein